MDQVSKTLSAGEIIAKTDDERRVVWGWASVYAKAGDTVFDREDDGLDEATVVSAAHSFVRDARVGKLAHVGEQVGEVVESMVFTQDLQKSLGIDLGKSGWLIGMHITNDRVWEMVKSGRLKAFSIGGQAVRETVNA